MGLEALSNQGFYSYFNPQEVPLFLCLTKTSKTVQTQRLVRYSLEEEVGPESLAGGKNESKSICMVHCANLLSIFSSQG